jgi:hypothetical protein
MSAKKDSAGLWTEKRMCGDCSVATLALGSQPRLRGCKVAGQEEGSPGVKAKALQGCGPRGRKPGSQGKGIARVRAKRTPRVTSHTPGSVRKCEGV